MSRRRYAKKGRPVYLPVQQSIEHVRDTLAGQHAELIQAEFRRAAAEIRNVELLGRFAKACREQGQSVAQALTELITTYASVFEGEDRDN
jgi:hypothetical protein